MIFFIIESGGAPPPPPPPSGLPLDSYTTGMAIACSFTVLVSSYLGSPLMRVRRDSDNTELDIGADAAGNIDTGALMTFVGSGSGYVTTWYDQSGNGRHIVQATASKQPKIVDKGLYLNELHFDGVDDYMHAPMVGANALSFMTNYDFWRIQDANTIVGCDDAFLNGSGNNATVLHYESSPNAIEAYTTTNGFATYSQLSDGSHLIDTAEHQVGFIADRSVSPVMTLWDNGTQVQSSQVNVSEPGDFGAYELRLGAISATVTTSAINYRNFVAYTGNRTSTMPAVSTALKSSTDALVAPNIQDHTYTTLASADGNAYTLYPAGDKPTAFQTLPVLLDTDKLSTSMVNNYNGLGGFIRFYGYSFGRPDHMGLSSGVRAFCRNPLGDNQWHEVANYRYLTQSKVFATHQIQELCVQVGNFGGAIVDGAACDWKLVVNGVDSNILVGQFTPNPGRFWYIDNVIGSDATGKPDDMSKPHRYVQHWTGTSSSFYSLWNTTTDSGDAGLRAGDTIIPRETGTPWSDQVGFDNRFCRFRSHTGSAPTGVVGHGYIAFDAYPGPIGGQAPETVYYNDPPGGGGCIQGVNSAYAGTYGQYWSVSNWVMTCNETSRGDAGMVNFQYGANNTRVYGCEMGPWPSTLVSPSNAKAGGVAGDGTNIKVKFCYIHDIECDKNNPSTSANENHLIYFDGGNNGSGYNQCAQQVEVSYNRLENAPELQTGGSAIQFYNSAASGTNAKFLGIKVHHNYINGCRKYGINFADSFWEGTAWDNVVLNTGLNGFRTNSAGGSGAFFRCLHNLFYNCYTGSGAAQGIVNNDNALDPATVYPIQHNILVLAANRGVPRADNDFMTDNAYSVSNGQMAPLNNLYYDPDALKSPPSSDTSPVVGNPLFASSTPVLPEDFVVQAGSPVLNAVTQAELIAIANDFFGMPRPQTGTGTPIGTKNDIGPFQGVGV